MDMNLLRVLDALLQEGSTVGAAQRVGLSQPAVSAALGRLRHALSDRLFVRRGQGLEPTDYARSIAGPLRRTLEELEGLLGGPAAFDPLAADEVFRLCGSDFFAEILMPPLIECLAASAPGVTVQMLDVPDGDLAAIELQEIDIALMPTFPLKEWAAHQPVMHSRMVVVARAGHPRIEAAGLMPGDVVPMGLYCALDHVVFSTEGKLATGVDDTLARMGRNRRIVMTLPFFSGVYHAVACSDAVALLPEQTAAGTATRMGLQVYQPPLTLAPVELSMVWLERLSARPAHRWLRETIAEILSRMDGGIAPSP